MSQKRGSIVKVLKMLEEKIASLVDLVKELKTEKVRLIEENAQWQAKIKSLEKSVTTDNQRLEELSQEKALTKMVVDDLIKSIDSLVRPQQR